MNLQLSQVLVSIAAGVAALGFGGRLLEYRRLHGRCVRLCRRIADELSQKQDPELVTERIFRVVIEHTNAMIGVLSFYSRGGDELQVIRVHGLGEDILPPGAVLDSAFGWKCPNREQRDKPVLLQEELRESLLKTARVELDSKQNMICIPVYGPGEIHGLLQLVSGAGQRFRKQHLTDLSGVGFYLGAAIHNARLIDTIQRQRDAAETLYEIGLTISRFLDLGSIIDYAVKQGHRVIMSDFTWFLESPLEQGADLTVKKVAGNGLEGYEPGRRIGLSKEVATLLQAKPANEAPSFVQLDNMLTGGDKVFCEEAVYRDFFRHGINSALLVPVRNEHGAQGLLCSFARRSHAFGDWDLRFMQRLANQVLIAINTAQLHQQRRQLAVVQERERLSDELHDNMAQVINGVSLEIHALRKRGRGSGVGEDFLGQIDQIGERIADAKARIRHAVFELRLPDGQSLWSNLRDFCVSFERWHELEVISDLPEQALPLAQDGQREVLRIVQELLWNIRRHSGVDQARLQGRCIGADRVRIVVGDLGRGADGETLQRGQGVATMRSRAARLDGTVSFDTMSGQGLTVSLEFPI